MEIAKIVVFSSSFHPGLLAPFPHHGLSPCPPDMWQDSYLSLWLGWVVSWKIQHQWASAYGVGKGGCKMVTCALGMVPILGTFCSLCTSNLGPCVCVWVCVCMMCVRGKEHRKYHPLSSNSHAPIWLHTLSHALFSKRHIWGLPLAYT